MAVEQSRSSGSGPRFDPSYPMVRSFIRGLFWFRFFSIVLCLIFCFEWILCLVEACKNFEDSGWAYILYSIARANSVLDKAQNWNEIWDFIPTEIALSTTERMLLIEINKYPLIVKKSEEQENPAILLDWLGGLCRLYNSYYASQRVILEDWSVNEVAYALAKAFKQVAKNATVLCNIATPERI